MLSNQERHKEEKSSEPKGMYKGCSGRGGLSILLGPCNHWSHICKRGKGDKTVSRDIPMKGSEPLKWYMTELWLEVSDLRKRLLDKSRAIKTYPMLYNI